MAAEPVTVGPWVRHPLPGTLRGLTVWWGCDLSDGRRLAVGRDYEGGARLKTWHWTVYSAPTPEANRGAVVARGTCANVAQGRRRAEMEALSWKENRE